MSLIIYITLLLSSIEHVPTILLFPDLLKNLYYILIHIYIS